MEIFKIENLSFAYPTSPDKLALDHITLSIQPGEYIALCGRSGSGKSTLLRHLKTVLTPSGRRAGRVLFDGVPLQDVDLKSQAARIGYVMQDPDSQIVTDQVWHELAFGLESIGCDQKTMRLRVAEMASYFGIQSWFHRNVSELSGGQKQLLNLASVMAMQPDVLILDEPASQLDPIAASDFLNTLSWNSIVSGPPLITFSSFGLEKDLSSDTGPLSLTFSEGAKLAERGVPFCLPSAVAPISAACQI